MLIFEQTEFGPVALVKLFKPGLTGQDEKDSTGSIQIVYEKRVKDQRIIQHRQHKDGKWIFNGLFPFEKAK